MDPPDNQHIAHGLHLAGKFSGQLRGAGIDLGTFQGTSKRPQNATRRRRNNIVEGRRVRLPNLRWINPIMLRDRPVHAIDDRLRLPRQMRHPQRPPLPLQRRFRHIHNLGHRRLPHPGCYPKMALLYSADLTGFIKYLDKVAILVVSTPMLSRFSARRLCHSPRRNSFPYIGLPTLLHPQKSQTLCNQANPGSFCRTPGVAYPPAASAPSVLSVNSVVNRCSAGMYPRPAPSLRTTTFRINTCKSVSKQRTLSPSRINTYEKTRGRGGTPPAA